MVRQRNPRAAHSCCVCAYLESLPPAFSGATVINALGKVESATGKTVRFGGTTRADPCSHQSKPVVLFLKFEEPLSVLLWRETQC